MDDLPFTLPEFPGPVARPDRYTIAEQTPRAIWVQNNDSHTTGIVRVNGQLIDVGRPVTLPSGAVVEMVQGDIFRPSYLVYEPNHAFDNLLTGSRATDVFSYTVSGQVIDQRARAQVTITVVGASDTDGLVPEPPFRPLEYTASYSDLIAAFGVNQAAATAHFQTRGFREGREIDFDGLEYIASYADLGAAFGTNRDAASAHFITHGTREGRQVTFDGLEYIASHDDLMAAFGVDRDAGAAHYLQYGAREGRPADNFDTAQYLANYADLQAAFGTDQEQATAHFIAYGRAEHRTDDPIAQVSDFLL